MTANANIKVGRVGDGLAFGWEGDEVVGITMELLHDMDRRYCAYSKFPDVAGRCFTVGPYLLETLEYDPLQNVIFARRVFI